MFYHVDHWLYWCTVMVNHGLLEGFYSSAVLCLKTTFLSLFYKFPIVLFRISREHIKCFGLDLDMVYDACVLSIQLEKELNTRLLSSV